jgi:hypothetical protein
MLILLLNMRGKSWGALLSRVWKAQADPGRDPGHEVAGQVSRGKIQFTKSNKLSLFFSGFLTWYILPR